MRDDGGGRALTIVRLLVVVVVREGEGFGAPNMFVRVEDDDDAAAEGTSPGRRSL